MVFDIAYAINYNGLGSLIEVKWGVRLNMPDYRFYIWSVGLKSCLKYNGWIIKIFII